MFSMWYVPNGIKLLFKKNGWYKKKWLIQPLDMTWFAKYKLNVHLCKDVDCRPRPVYSMQICKLMSNFVGFSVAAFTCFHLWPMAWMAPCPTRKTASGQESSGWGPGIYSKWSTRIYQHSKQNFKKYLCLKY